MARTGAAVARGIGPSSYTGINLERTMKLAESSLRQNMGGHLTDFLVQMDLTALRTSFRTHESILHLAKYDPEEGAAVMEYHSGKYYIKAIMREFSSGIWIDFIPSIMDAFTKLMPKVDLNQHA